MTFLVPNLRWQRTLVMVPFLISDTRRPLEAVEARARADERARILSKRLFPSELVELTGYQRSKNQIRWLREHCWPFELASGGGPRVLRDAVMQAGGGTE